MKPLRATTARRSWPAQRAWLLAAAAVFACTLGCGDGDSATPLAFEGTSTAPIPAAEQAEKAGSLSFALTTREGVDFDQFSYAIIGPNFVKSGTIDLSKSNTVSTLVEGIPVGSGYSVTLMGASTPPVQAQCSGSASFAIEAGAVTNVPVAIACHVQDATPPQAAAVPVPPLAPVALGLLLLAVGTMQARRRR